MQSYSVRMDSCLIGIEELATKRFSEKPTVLEKEVSVMYLKLASF